MTVSCAFDADPPITALEVEWDVDGFFGRLRSGEFDLEGYRRAKAVLAAISIPDDALLPLRFVSLIWYIPIYMRWQIERITELGGDLVAYKRAIDHMTNECERLFGLP